MIAPEICIKNLSSATLNVRIRPLNGRLLIFLFKAPTASSTTLATGEEIILRSSDKNVSGCIRNGNLRIMVRNVSGKPLSYGTVFDKRTERPTMIFGDPDKGGAP